MKEFKQYLAEAKLMGPKAVREYLKTNLKPAGIEYTLNTDDNLVTVTIPGKDKGAKPVKEFVRKMKDLNNKGHFEDFAYDEQGKDVSVFFVVDKDFSTL